LEIIWFNNERIAVLEDRTQQLGSERRILKKPNRGIYFMEIVASESMHKYFAKMREEIDHSYKIAREARKKGLDPHDDVEIMLANSMAERVIGLISIVAPQVLGAGITERIEELEDEIGLLDWRVGFRIAEEIAQQKFCKFPTKIEAIEVGIRTGFAYLTLGIVAAPLEGFVGLKLKRRRDNGKEYFALQYAGPVRGAGGTASSVSVILADYVRVKMGYAPWDPTEKEVSRYVIEVNDYHDRVTNLQYRPSNEELKFMVEHLPIEVDGDPTERIEVSNYKDIPRIETNLIRGGMCLVIAEGLCQKSPKLWKRLSKWGKDYDLDWEFMGDFIKLKEEIHAKHSAAKEGPASKDAFGKDGKKIEVLRANDTFIADIVAGRPVITHPMAPGGLRLRYGRGRTSGFSAAAMNPASLIVIEDYIAVGTQLKVERPGKAATITLCDTIDGPTVILKDGTVKYLHTEAEAKEVVKEVHEVLFLGDILFNYGDFSENGHKLVPAGYCPEWWSLEVQKAILGKEAFDKKEKLNFEQIKEKLKLTTEQITEFQNSVEKPLYVNPKLDLALKISKEYHVALHSYYSYYWKLLNISDLNSLVSYLKLGKIQGVKGSEEEIHSTETTEKIILPLFESQSVQIKGKALLEKIGIPHLVLDKENLVLEKDQAKLILKLFNLNSQKQLSNLAIDPIKSKDCQNALEYLNSINSVIQQDKAGTFIGARMGRPEKSKMRSMKGKPHVLFPVGEEGGRMKTFQSALEKGTIKSMFNKEWLIKFQQQYGELFETKDNRSDDYAYGNLNIKDYFKKVLKELNLRIYPDVIKGVKGVSNKAKIPENLIKGIYRAKYSVAVNKDGTTRYDCTELPLTHFKPKEIETSIKKLIELGYTQDIHGKELTDTNQVLEMKPQDLVLPNYDAIEDSSSKVLLRITKFIDEIMVNLYKMKPFYNAEKQEDLIGHLVIGLAPHISAGTVGRIIGFSQTQSLLAHPMYHAGMRRDCDGDEAAVMLLMDGLLNFSKEYLPSSRGSTMDAALVLTPVLSPAEVDDQVLGVDVMWNYPLELYEAALEMKKPWELKYGPDQKKIEQLDDRVGKENQYEDFGFTHDVDDFNKGIQCSAYKTLPSMKEKLFGQMDIAKKVRAVDMDLVAALVIRKHFLADIKGNFRKFSMQGFRCTTCNTKYRRPPISMNCTECTKGNIIFTISQGSVVKYVQMSLDLCDEYDFSPYLKETINLLKLNIDVVFGKEKDRQVGLSAFMG
jgi:DNA polymerase II large subunit